MATQVSNFIRALNRIDPTQGLVQYVSATKPYHSKILDVLVEYVYAEDIKVTFRDQHEIDINLRRPDVINEYDCGPANMWDPLMLSDDPDGTFGHYSILSAKAPEKDTAGEIIYDPLNNSFVVATPTYVPFSVAVASTTTNQFAFTKTYTIVGTVVSARIWEIDDQTNTLTSEISPGDTIYISSDSGTSGNGKYTVGSTITHAAGITSVEVVEPVPVQAIGDGIFHRLLTLDDIPSWTDHTAIKFSSDGDLPNPLMVNETYYFQPTTTVGYFNITRNKYPHDESDYVRLHTIGTGNLTVVRNEVFASGDVFKVDSTPFSINKGIYSVKLTTTEGSNTRIFTDQPLSKTVIAGSPIAGGTLHLMVYKFTIVDVGVDSFTISGDHRIFSIGRSFTVAGSSGNDGQWTIVSIDPYDSVNDETTICVDLEGGPNLDSTVDGTIIVKPLCPPSKTSDLYTGAIFSERISFTYKIDLFDNMGSTIVENAPSGYGNMNWGGGPGGPFGTSLDVPYVTITAATTGHMVLPTGFDTQLFDVGPMNESFEDIRQRNAREGTLGQ